MKATINTPSYNTVFETVSPALSETDIELIKTMGAEVEVKEGDKPEAMITFKEDLPEEAKMLLNMRMTGASPSEVVKALTDAKEKTLPARDSEESKKTGPEGGASEVEVNDESRPK